MPSTSASVADMERNCRFMAILLGGLDDFFRPPTLRRAGRERNGATNSLCSVPARRSWRIDCAKREDRQVTSRGGRYHFQLLRYRRASIPRGREDGDAR